MSNVWWGVLGVVILALASVSVRTFVALEGRHKPGRLAVLLVSVGMAILLVGLVTGTITHAGDATWSCRPMTPIDLSWWPLGMALGLAVVELGPTVLSVVRALLRRKGGDV